MVKEILASLCDQVLEVLRKTVDVLPTIVLHLETFERDHEQEKGTHFTTLKVQRISKERNDVIRSAHKV